jgi:flavin reductase (DIM6/NTAB) family NADH-FMN oxidoreductase RutF
MFSEISPDKLCRSPFKMIGSDWLLICAPDKSQPCGANAMTASWGGLGVIWHKNVATIYVRPQRHTFSLIEQCDEISLCFLGEQFRNALKLCGTKSGRDMDKISHSGLSVCFDGGAPVIEQSEVVLVCKKAYSDFIKEECFDDESHISSYPAKDYHKMYILEIKKILVKQ